MFYHSLYMMVYWACRI